MPSTPETMPSRTEQSDAARLEALHTLCRQELSAHLPSAEVIDKMVEWSHEAMHPSAQYLASSRAAGELLAALDGLRKVSQGDPILTDWLRDHGDAAGRALERSYQRQTKRPPSDRVDLVGALATPPWFESRELAALYILAGGQNSAPTPGESAAETLYRQTNLMRDTLRRHGQRERETRGRLVRAVMRGDIDPPWLLAKMREILDELDEFFPDPPSERGAKKP